MPRGIGIAGAALVLVASIAYGVVTGDHVSAIIDGFNEARDRAANAAGFRIVSIALSGNHHVSREEVLAVAGITGTTSLPFVDVELARERLKHNPWIGDASLLKLYPGELQIAIKEREAFALWQKDRRVNVIADDGTVLEPYVAPHLVQLPLVVGNTTELLGHELLRARPARHRVRIVARPHDVAHAETVTEQLDRVGLVDVGEVDVAVEVVARELADLGEVVLLAGGHVVDDVEIPRNPAEAGFHELFVPAKELAMMGKSPLKVESGLLQKECAALFDEWKRSGKARSARSAPPARGPALLEWWFANRWQWQLPSVLLVVPHNGTSSVYWTNERYR